MNDLIANLLGEWSKNLNVYSALFRIILAVFIAAVIGCERSTKRHSAGLRTFMLVALSTSLIMILEISLLAEESMKIYVLSCAGIIGVAVISVRSLMVSSKNQIKGLTTSVALWASAILGLTSGAGLYTVTLIGFILLLCCLSFFPILERYLRNRSNHFEIYLELKNGTDLKNFATTLRRLGLRIDEIEANKAYKGTGLSVYSVSLSIISPELKKYKTHTEIIEALKTLDFVHHIEESWL